MITTEKMPINNWNPPIDTRKLVEVKTNQSPTTPKLHQFVPNGFLQPLGHTWERFKDFFLRPTEFYKSIRQLAEQPKVNFNETNTKLLKDAFLSNEYPKVRPFLQQIFQHTSSEGTFNFLSQLIKDTLTASINTKPTNSIVTLNQRINEIIPLNKLEQVAKTKLPFFISTQQSAKNTSNLIKNQIAADFQETYWSIKQTALLYFVTTFEWFIDTLMNLFELHDLFEETSSAAEAHYRLQLILSIFTGIGALVGAISAYCGSFWLSALVLSASSVTLATIAYIYFMHLKPCPEYLPNCINLTSEATKGNLEPVLGRDQYINELIQQLRSNVRGIRSHPLLIGQSGVGKTEIFKGLAYQIAQGRVPDDLKGKKVFYINATDLISGGTWWGKLSGLTQILRKLKRYEHKCIIIIDEIQVAWKGKSESLLGEKLKTILDPGPGGLPFVICATTPEEYDINIKGNLAFERRFKKIHVDPIKDDKCLLVLDRFMYKEAPDLELKPAIMKYLLTKATEKFPKSPNPYKAKHLLAKAISFLRTNNNQKLRTDLLNLKDERAAKELEFMRGSGLQLSLDTVDGQELLNQVNMIDGKINEIEKILQTEDEKLERFHHIKNKLREAKEEQFQLALKISNATSQNNKYWDWVRQYHLLEVYMNPAWEKIIKEYQNTEGRQTEIDTALIDQMIADDFKEVTRVQAIPVVTVNP